MGVGGNHLTLSIKITKAHTPDAAILLVGIYPAGRLTHL